MKKSNWKTSKNKNDKLYQFDTDHKVYCNCGEGHGVVFYNTHRDRLICFNCGHWIYRDEKTRLKYEMKERGILKCLEK